MGYSPKYLTGLKFDGLKSASLKLTLSQLKPSIGSISYTNPKPSFPGFFKFLLNSIFPKVRILKIEALACLISNGVVMNCAIW